MMHRAFDCSTWGDPWFHRQPLLAKFVFICLFTNSRTTSIGSVEITPDALKFETGIAEEDVCAILTAWNDEREPRVLWFPQYDLVWVKNFFRHQNCNPNFAKSASRAAEKLPLELRRMVYVTYPQLSPPMAGDGGNGSNAGVNGSKPYTNGSQTVNEPLPSASHTQRTVPDKDRTGQDRTESGQDRTATGQARRRGAKPAGESATDEGPNAGTDVVVSLISLGVGSVVAQRLAAEHPAEVIRNQIAWLPSRKPRDPAAMIVDAIQSDMSPPKLGSAAAQKRKRQDEERQRQLDAKRQDEEDSEARQKAERQRCQRTFDAMALDDQAELLRLAGQEFDSEEEYAHIRGMPDSRLKARLVSQTVNTIRNRLMAGKGILTELP